MIFLQFFFPAFGKMFAFPTATANTLNNMEWIVYRFIERSILTIYPSYNCFLCICSPVKIHKDLPVPEPDAPLSSSAPLCFSSPESRKCHLLQMTGERNPPFLQPPALFPKSVSTQPWKALLSAQRVIKTPVLSSRTPLQQSPHCLLQLESVLPSQGFLERTGPRDTGSHCPPEI